MRKYFWDQQQNRLRALWRILVHLAIWGAILAVTQAVLLLIQGQAVSWETLSRPDGWTKLVTLLISVYLMARYVDKRRFSDFGLNLKDKDWWYDFGFGLFLGGILIVGIFLAQYLLGWVEIVNFALPTTREILIGMTLSVAALAATSVYRSLWIWGYTLRNTAEGFFFLNRIDPRAAVLAALLVCLAYFAFGINRAFAVNTRFISNIFRAGMLLALPFILTQRLGMTIGLSIGWKLVELNVFGYPVVNVTDTAVSIIRINNNGPSFWTGYPLGLGTGTMAMVALIIASFIITRWNKWRTGRKFHGALAYYTPREVSLTAVSDNAQEKQLDPSAGE